MEDLRGKPWRKDEGEVLMRLRALIEEVLEHGFGEVVVKIQNGKVVTMEKREVYKLEKTR